MTNSLSKSINHHWSEIYYHLHYVHRDSLSHQAIRLLQHLEMRTRLTVGQLSQLLSISHNTASEHVKRLIQKGLIQKERNPRDERVVFVTLTEEGKNLLYQNTRLDDEKLELLINQFPPDKQVMMKTAFALLAREAKKCFSSSK